MKPTVVAVIPARLQSSRFPRKALYDIHGYPLLYHVWKAVSKCKTVDRAFIASDSSEILDAAKKFGAETFRSSPKPKTGSDRVAEFSRSVKSEVYVNVQGDCFGISPAAIDKVVSYVSKTKSVCVGTLAAPIASDDDLFSPNVVKVVVDAKGRALWFSRYPIPYIQQASAAPRCRQATFLAHIGVYVFRNEAIKQFAGWKRTRCETLESLEQLRILENGGDIHVCTVRQKPISIDSPEDAKKIVLRYRKAG